VEPAWLNTHIIYEGHAMEFIGRAEQFGHQTAPQLWAESYWTLKQ